jgi:hypothetical protein
MESRLMKFTTLLAMIVFLYAMTWLLRESSDALRRQEMQGTGPYRVMGIPVRWTP